MPETTTGPNALPDPAEEATAELGARLRAVIAGGYSPLHEVMLIAGDLVEPGDDPPVPRERAWALAERLWDERRREQAAWTGETDPERLTRALAALEAAGITAREHFTCCMTCGDAEIGHEAAPGARGFVYFHRQDTDAAVEGYGLALRYGGFDGSRATTVAVGHEIVAQLGATGLSTEWDGDPRRVIMVTPMEWRRRLPG